MQAQNELVMYLKSCLSILNQGSSDSSAEAETCKENILGNAVVWCRDDSALVRKFLPRLCSAEFASHVYSLALGFDHFCSFFYKLQQWQDAVNCITFSVTLYESYIPTRSESEKPKLLEYVHKRRTILSETFRRLRKYRQAASVIAVNLLHYAAEAQLWGHDETYIPYDILVDAWLKIKRDALKDNDSTLKVFLDFK